MKRTVQGCDCANTRRLAASGDGATAALDADDATIDLASSAAESALFTYAQSALRAYGEVETRLSAEGFLADQELALATAATEATAARVLAEERYAKGLSDLITLLESQRRAFDSQSRLLAIKRQRLDARVNLYLALGGGFNDSTPPQHAEVSQ